MHMEGGAKGALSPSASVPLLLSYLGFCPAVSLDPGASLWGEQPPAPSRQRGCWASPGHPLSCSRTSGPRGPLELCYNVNLDVCGLPDDRSPNRRFEDCDKESEPSSQWQACAQNDRPGKSITTHPLAFNAKPLKCCLLQLAWPQKYQRQKYLQLHKDVNPSMPTNICCRENISAMILSHRQGFHLLMFYAKT